MASFNSLPQLPRQNNNNNKKKKGLLPSLTQLIHNFKKSQKKREKRKKEKIKTPENEPVLPIFNRLFSFTSESGIHVFQSILSKQPRLNFIPFISVLLLSFFFFVDLRDKVVEK